MAASTSNVDAGEVSCIGTNRKRKKAEMEVKLSTKAEFEAKKAEGLEAFGGLNLLHIKRQIAHLLALIGRDGIFDEYTRHDISHIDKMLSALDWLIPDTTKMIMTSADWLLSVLGIYFHDVGMLVTKQEFADRESSGFSKFCEDVLFAGDQGEDYKHKVGELPTDEKDRFLYQEFVRHNHAERVRWWIAGSAPSSLGISDQAADEVDKLLHTLDNQFRRDLGLVAESHHLNDLDDLRKYGVSQPYGGSDAETGNLQYAAILLRASDLLHITTDRTPAIAYRLINPLDPLSQMEWAKQMAVKRVRSKLGLNEEGELDNNARRDTVEVHAFFTKEEGFFGLTAYLRYAASQLAKCHHWVSVANRKGAAQHEFPWSKLDDSNIETEGFIKDEFRFTIDQARILDLLTGHTLYNDSSVVLRELIQNSLDAIRVRQYDEPDSAPGEVQIAWDSDESVLSVSDNGTGMTQEVIQRHLLRVGASLYQDEGFKKSHPGFSSISRFGIGVLSTFMIADTVEIITCHEDETEARRLALRSVHDKYLVRLLSKESEPVNSLAPHGTLFKLKIRPSVKVPDIVETARRWVVIPGCKVTVTVDQQDPVPIGYETPKEALTAYLRTAGKRVIESTDDRPDTEARDVPVRVVEHNIAGTMIAYAVRWSPYFHAWSFLGATGLEKIHGSLPIGSCVEGIRVDSSTPGFSRTNLVALANAFGENSPKTNVARSGMEATAERDAMTQAVYTAYCSHAKDEISNLMRLRGHSLTWATQEAQFVLSPLLRSATSRRESDALNPDLLENAVEELPILLTEQHEGREAVSCSTLRKEERFWTIDCPLFTSAEYLIRETSANVSIRSVVKALGADIQLPAECLLCGTTQYSHFHSAAFRGREISKIVVLREQRRLDVMWQDKATPARWLTLPDRWSDWCQSFIRKGSRHERWRPSTLSMSVLKDGVESVGLGSEVAIRHLGMTYLTGDNPAHGYVRPQLEAELHKGNFDTRIPPVVGVLALYHNLLTVRGRVDNLETHARTFWQSCITEVSDATDDMQSWEGTFNESALQTAIRETYWSTIDPSRWSIREDDDD